MNPNSPLEPLFTFRYPDEGIFDPDRAAYISRWNEVASSSPNFSLSVSEKLSRYGVNALSAIAQVRPRARGLAVKLRTAEGNSRK
jgi:hypothetical protein